jgi:DNA-binding PadR family transcriptional regulator
MYEFLVLGRLANAPMHGYMIAKIIEKIMGPFRHVQWGALYPILNRLEREGLIRAEEVEPECEGRSRKAFAITEAGRARLHELVMDTEHHQGEYDMIFFHKVALFGQLLPEERIYLARHYAVYSQQNIDHLERSRRGIGQEVAHSICPAQEANIQAVITHRIEHWHQERAWAEALLASEHLTKEAV